MKRCILCNEINVSMFETGSDFFCDKHLKIGSDSRKIDGLVYSLYSILQKILDETENGKRLKTLTREEISKCCKRIIGGKNETQSKKHWQ